MCPWLLGRGGIDGIVALGCVIRGETPHFEYVSLGATTGLESLARECGVPDRIWSPDDGHGGSGPSAGRRASRETRARKQHVAVLEMCELAATLR